MAPLRVDIGIHPDYPVADSVTFAQRIERSRFGGLWVADSQDLFRDCFVSMTAIALNTDRIPLGTGVTNPVLRHPSVLAGAAATLDEITSGRFTLGLGSGETAVQTAGLRPATLIEMEEALRSCRKYLMNPWGGPSRNVPLVLAATGPRALNLAGRLADSAYMKIGCDVGLLNWAREQIDGAGESVQRTSACTATLLLPVGLGDTMEEAYREVAGFAAATAGAVHQAVPGSVIADGIRHELGVVADLVSRARRDESYTTWLDDPARIGNLPRKIVDMFCIADNDPRALAERLRALPVDRVVIPLLTKRREEQLTRLTEVLALC